MDMKREDIEKIYDQGKEAVILYVQDIVREFTAKIEALTERVSELEKADCQEQPQQQQAAIK